MPLSHSKALTELDLDTQAIVSAAYPEACIDLEDPNRSLAQLGELRKLLGDEMARGRQPELTHDHLPGAPADLQARYIEAAVNGVIIASIYLPNGNPKPGPKFDYKLAWFERLIRHVRKLHKMGLPVALAGDFNVVPTDRDIYSTKSWYDDALLQPEPRTAYKKLLKQGWTDSLREMHPDDERLFTSGTTYERDGNVMPACVLITFCSARYCQRS